MDKVLLAIDEEQLIATITVNRPKALNALDVETAEGLQAAMATLNARQDIRCIVFKGAGRAFMAGGDVQSFSDFSSVEATVNALIDALAPVVMSFQKHPAIVIACVHGAVAGAGLSLMAASDLVLAADDTRFLMAYDKIGAPPDCGGSYFLPRLLGEKVAASLMYLGETWNAETALARGLVNRVLPAEDFESSAMSVVQQVNGRGILAYQQYKRLVKDSYTRPLADQMEAERHAFCAATRTEPFKEGVLDFIGGGKK